MSSLSSSRALPEALKPLAELACDLRWASVPAARRLWQRLDAERYARCGNPAAVLEHASGDRLEQAAADPAFVQEVDRLSRLRAASISAPSWFAERGSGTDLKTVAYFSAEFGLSDALPIYASGLGILAAEHLKSASDLGVPMVAIGLLYRRGVPRQTVADDGWQVESYGANDPADLPVEPAVDAQGSPLVLELPLPGRTLRVAVWQTHVGRVPLYLLDSNHALNSARDRSITADLFAPLAETRLLQRMVLGISGWQLVERLGLDVQVCHWNATHAVLAALARAASFMEAERVSFPIALCATRAGNILTLHAAAEGEIERFESTLLVRYLQPLAERIGLAPGELLALGRRDPEDEYEHFNMAYLAARTCGCVDGVSHLHARVARGLLHELFEGWPRSEVPVGYVTGGVHTPSWVSCAAERAWSEARQDTGGEAVAQALVACTHRASSRGDQGAGGERVELSVLAESIDRLPDERLWAFRCEARGEFVNYVRHRLERHLRDRGASADAIERARNVLDPNCLTLGFAGRFAEFRRPNLLLQDADRLTRILCDAERPAQLVVAGKAHPEDNAGKEMIQQMVWFACREEVRDRVVFLEDYDLATARRIAGGIDVWISTSRRPSEACGVGSMKAVASGGLIVGTLDGWWAEAFDPALGWAFGGDREHGGQYDAEDAAALYDVLEREVAAEFYDRDDAGVPRAWISRMRASVKSLVPQVGSDRMVRQYVEQVYEPSAASYIRRAADGARLARDLERWRLELAEKWPAVRFGEARCHEADGQWHFEVRIDFGPLDPALVQVQLFADASQDGEPARIPMSCEEKGEGGACRYVYRASVPAERPAEHFTPRIVPHHPEAHVPLEASQSLWCG